MQGNCIGVAVLSGLRLAQPVYRHPDFQLPRRCRLFLSGHPLHHRQCLGKGGFGFGKAPLIVKQGTQIALSVRAFHLPFGLFGIERHQLVGQPLVFAELRLGLFALTALVSDIAHPEHALGMIENAVRIVGIARQRFRRGCRRCAESGQPAHAVPADIAHFADQMQRAAAAAQRVGVQIARALAGIVFERALANHVERIEPPDRLQLFAQIGQHEFDQSIGFRALVARIVALLDREPGHPAHHGGQQQRSAGDQPRAQRPAPIIAPDQLVQPNPQHRRRQLKPGPAPAIAAAAGIGGQRRIDPLIGNLPGGVHQMVQRFGEAFGRGIVRIAIDNQREDLFGITVRLEPSNLAVDPFRFGRTRRADHNQEFGCQQRRFDRFADTGPGGFFFAVFEQRHQPGRHRAARRFLADQRARRAIGLNRVVQPFAPGRIGPAITDEAFIAEL